MQAVILAGGKGTRLKPYTTVFPKPLMPVGDHPILEVVVRQLKKFGFDRAVLAVGPQHEMFRLFFENGEKWGLRIDYALEDRPLGTAGPLRNLRDLDEHFLMMNGDILTDLDYRRLMEFHHGHGHPLTIVTHRRVVDIDYGVLETGEDGTLLGYTEKPRLTYTVSMGVYVVSRRVIELIPEGRPFDFPELVQALLREGQKVVTYPYEGYWLDIGRPDDYAQAVEDFERRKTEFL
jgi:NDP-sugar pyrophosphorylase family protein